MSESVINIIRKDLKIFVFLICPEDIINAQEKLTYFLIDNSKLVVSFVLVVLNESQESQAPVITNGVELICKMSVSVALIKQFNVEEVPIIIGVDELDKVYFRISFGIKLNQSASDHLFEEAMQSYNNFDLVTSVRIFLSMLSIDDNNKNVLFNLSGIFHMLNYPSIAIGFLRRLLVLDCYDSIAQSFLWAITISGDCRELAISTYRSLSALGDLNAKTKLAVLTQEGAIANRMDPLYAKQIYDEMADKFENKLVDHLGYRGPWILHDLLESLIQEKHTLELPHKGVKGSWRILDLGCGSGLCGKIFASFCTILEGCITYFPKTEETFDISTIFAGNNSSIMAGVDISDRMIEISSKTGYYSHLVSCDLIEALECFGCDAMIDLVIAADTLIYIGEIGLVFAKIWKVLTNNGIFIFSTEDLDDSPMKMGQYISKLAQAEIRTFNIDNEFEIDGAVPGWGAQLLSSARFAHSNTYIFELCKMHRFRVLTLKEKVVLRTEETIPLSGNMFIIQKVI
eukprot:gene12197-16340_t